MHDGFDHVGGVVLSLGGPRPLAPAGDFLIAPYILAQEMSLIASTPPRCVQALVAMSITAATACGSRSPRASVAGHDDGGAMAAVDGQVADHWFDPALMPPTPLDGAPTADESSAVAATADGDAACETLPSDACVRCCALGNVSGKAELDLVGRSCMCTSCDDMCVAATCTMGGFPQGSCTACIKDGLRNACAQNGYLDQLCAPDHECGRYVACLMACP